MLVKILPCPKLRLRAVIIDSMMLTQTDPVSRGLSVNPEVDPRYDDDQSTWNIRVNKKVPHVPLQLKVHMKSGIQTCGLIQNRNNALCADLTRSAIGEIRVDVRHTKIS